MVSRVKNPASDRQKRLQGRRVIPLSRRQINENDAAEAKHIAAEVLADLKQRRTPDAQDAAEVAIIARDAEPECAGCGTVTDDHGEGCAYEWDDELREYVLQTETPD